MHAARESEETETEQVSLGMEKVRLWLRQALMLLKAWVMIIFYDELNFVCDEIIKYVW